MEFLQHFLHYLLHVDEYLITFVTFYGYWTYIILFTIIFCETGLVIFPFLPGDSLIFAAGSIAAHANESLSIKLLFLCLTLASILGNKINYLIGRNVGPKIFSMPNSWLFNKKHLEQAHEFYEKHGGKTIIFARFIPIIRTFAPFVAGVGYMKLSLFSFYNLISALLWVGILLTLGYYFGSIPIIKENFTLVVYAIIAISLLPPTAAFVYKKFLKT